MRKGLILRNGLVPNSSWHKRVNHWKLSFLSHNIVTEIYSVYPISLKVNKNSPDSLKRILYFHAFRYFLSPYLILRKLIQEKPDFILLANGGFFEFFTIPLYCRFAKIPFVIDMVDTIGREHRKKKTSLDYLIIMNKRMFNRYIASKAKVIFVISSTLESYYKNLLPNKKILRSIPSTVNVEEFALAASKSTEELGNSVYEIFGNTDIIKIFYAGTITRLNGIEFFLKVLTEILSEQKINLKIIFAVIEGEIANLIELVNDLGLREYLIIVPPVSQNQLPILLCKSDILFIPEQGIEVANAGFPGKTAEYLMSGNPVITTNFSDLNLYLVDGLNACISDIGDFKAYKYNLQKLLMDKEFRSSIGQAGKITAEKEFSHLNCALPYVESVHSYYNNKS